MACVARRVCWDRDGVRVWDEPRDVSEYQRLEFRCGNCSGCRLAKAGEWETRLMLEGKGHASSICLTATYDGEHLPPLGSLRASDVVAFNKALRQLVARRGGGRYSFDCCGEYSPFPVMRPHYHMALFGYDPPNPVRWAKSGAGNMEFVSDELTRAWGRGLITYQPWSAGAARYCAGHQAWKLTGELGRHRRQVIDEHGEVIGTRDPEFHRVSSRPGIGRRFMEKHGVQALLLGMVVAVDKPKPLPGYFMRRGKVDHPELAAAAADKRMQAAVSAAEGITPERAAVIEECKRLTIERGSRKKGVF